MAALLISAAIFAGGPTAADVDAMLELGEKQKAERIEHLRNRVKQLSRDRSQRKQQRETAAEMRKLQKSKDTYIPAIPLDHAPGAIGRLHQVGQVFQVLGEQEMLIEVHYTYMFPSVRGRPGEQVVIMVPKTETKTVLIRGLETTGLADGAPTGIEEDAVFWVSDNYTYQTAIGTTNTVTVFEPVDIEDLLERHEAGELP